MRIVMVALSVAALVVSSNGCSSSSSAQGPRGGTNPVPVSVIVSFAALNDQLMLLNTQTDTQTDPNYDVWVQDISTGESSLLMEDARCLLVEDHDNVWHGQTLLTTPAVPFSNSTGAQIWITDGTIEGTQLLVDLPAAPPTSFQLRDVHLRNDQLIVNVSEFNTVTEEFNPYLVVVDLEEALP